MSYDLDAIKTGTDLEDLFRRVVGPEKRQGATVMWPCPSRDHGGEQTGTTPPVMIYPAGDNGDPYPHWTCHGCGAGGSCIDVLTTRGVSVAEAIEQLAGRLGLRNEGKRTSSSATSTHPATSSTATVAPVRSEKPAKGPADPVAAMESYAGACRELLFKPQGRAVLAWLRARGYSDDALIVNGVGADPGPDLLSRAHGLPYKGPAAVFPVFATTDPGSGADYPSVTYLQARYLDAEAAGQKHHNPLESIYGKSPRVAVLADPRNMATEDTILCEGPWDALTAHDAGYRSAAILGAAQPDAGMAERVVDEFPTGGLVITFDNDTAGEKNTPKLADLLAVAGAGRRIWTQAIPEGVKDLNEWRVKAGDQFPTELAAAWDPRPHGWEPIPTALDLVDGFMAKLADRAGVLAIPTGFVSLDHLLANGGWREGSYLLGAPPGTGKTALALQMAMEAARNGVPVLFVSLEDPPEKLLARIFCRKLEMPLAAFYNRDPDYLAGVVELMEAGELPFDRFHFKADPYIAGADEAGTVGRVRRWARALAEDYGRPPMIFVDYLQRMRPPEPERRLDERLRVSEAGKALVQLARDIETPVVSVSSVGRLSYDKGRTMAAFKASGDLEYDADACFLLTDPAQTDDDGVSYGNAPVDLELHVVKNRYGPLTIERGPIPLEFDRRHGSFRERTSSPYSNLTATTTPGRPVLRPV